MSIGYLQKLQICQIKALFFSLSFTMPLCFTLSLWEDTAPEVQGAACLTAAMLAAEQVKQVRMAK